MCLDPSRRWDIVPAALPWAEARRKLSAWPVRRNYALDEWAEALPIAPEAPVTVRVEVSCRGWGLDHRTTKRWVVTLAGGTEFVLEQVS